jgi:hypothetical protein
VSGLRTDSAFDDPDRAYRALIDAHRGLSEEESAALNTRLVLILANHIGDLEVLTEAIALAQRSLEVERRPPNSSSPAPHSGDLGPLSK